MLQTTLDLQPVTLTFKDCYDRHLRAATEEGERGCEYTFANVYLWGHQQAALCGGHVLLFSQFDDLRVYPYPVGAGDKRAALDAILADAAARGISCRITELIGDQRQTLETLYPGKFRFFRDRDADEYVYAIDDLADLRGKKYHGKRNHCTRFRNAHPDCIAEELSEDNRPAVCRMLEAWYADRLASEPDGDFEMEREALSIALRDFRALEMEGVILRCGEEVLAMTLGSRLSHDTFDVHFEKARADVEGAYAAINQAFARHIRAKYPEVRYLDREEDLGHEGLRRAKESYKPHHMIEKWWALPTEEVDRDCDR